MSSVQTRHRVIGLYKELIRLGRDYPNPGYNFVPKVQAAFRASAGLTDQKAIDEKLALAEHVKNETLALISLSKYRYLRRTYCVPIKDTIPDVSLENTNK
ncbi:Complex 1 LYR protein [Phaffia rhodozyma]|uniref:Complex 1 LYR protein n=1 Tax=Phaffia rhodozyma TaxID=264483 RepID=A0A0F7SL39_PHARH|nr:Complex 1 LYR protein [Phaffia rhodozyma]